MNTQRRTVWTVACMGGLLIGGVVFSFSRLANARSQADRAKAELITVQHTLEEIETLNGKPELASVDAERSAQLSRHIETVAAQAGIDPSQIKQIQTQPPRRIDSGPYLRQPTHVLIEQVTLAALVELLHDLDATGKSLQLDDLRLIAPREPLVGDRWQAEFTVSYLIYEPIETRADGSQ